MTRPHGTRHARRAGLIAGFLGLLGALMAPTHAATPTAASDLPSTSSVKAIMDGVGHWKAYPADIATLGGKPRSCRSDRQFLGYDQVEARTYVGSVEGIPRSTFSSAEVVVLTYDDAETAQQAVEQNSTYAERCPKVTEWTCEDCDGISTTWRTAVGFRQVGDESVGWRFRAVGNLKSVGYTLIARHEATVVQATVTRTRDVVGPRGSAYPRLMSKRTALRLGRTALENAT